MGPTHCLVVSSPMPSSVLGAVRARFEDVRLSATPDRTVIECSIPDQAALRALLTQIWDWGGAVVLVEVGNSGRIRDDHAQR